MRQTEHYCQLICQREIDENDVVAFVDIIQSIVPAKIHHAVTADGESVEIVATVYNDDNGSFVYEVSLEEQMSLTEGEDAAELLLEEFDFDFEFEISLDV